MHTLRDVQDDQSSASAGGMGRRHGRHNRSCPSRTSLVMGQHLSNWPVGQIGRGSSDPTCRLGVLVDLWLSSYAAPPESVSLDIGAHCLA